MAAGNLVRQHGQQPDARCDGIASRRNRCSARPPHTNSIRWPPLNRSQLATAMIPMPPVRDVRAAARRQVERPRRRSAAACRREATLSAADSAAASSRRRTGSSPADLPRRRGSPRFPRPQSRHGEQLARQVDRRHVGAEMEARRAHAKHACRSPPTARAGRCAAACDRTAAASRLSPDRRPWSTSFVRHRLWSFVRRFVLVHTCAIVPSSSSIDIDDAKVAQRARCRTAGRRTWDRRRCGRGSLRRSAVRSTATPRWRRTPGVRIGVVEARGHLARRLAGRYRAPDRCAHRRRQPAARRKNVSAAQLFPR